MTLDQIINSLGLTVLTDLKDFKSLTPSYGYTSDLLSCVMSGAKNQGVWVTLQAHNNIVAVAALLELAAVIITEGAMPDETTVAKANEQGITLLSTEKASFYIAGKLWEMGLRDV
ncbi:MAG: serine kinase [Anaerolineaceae bacterium]|nr:serine kinase [Anaerolineaceae bacterium]